ncbi:MAG: DUF3575 domain-containing protein [Bacteroidota bacterium]
MTKTIQSKYNRFVGNLLSPLIPICITLTVVSAQAQSNFVSTDPFLPAFGTVELHYERQILPRISAGIGIGNKFSSGLLKISGMSGERIQSDDISFTGIRVMPEFRWYVNTADKGLTGLYFGMYYKYQSNNSSISSAYTPVTGDDAKVDLDISIQTHAVGLEMGYKLFVAKRFFADFIIGGLGIAKSRFDIEIKSDIPEGYFNALSDEVSNFSILEPITPNVETTDGRIEGDFLLPSLRYGIKFGIAF